MKYTKEMTVEQIMESSREAMQILTQFNVDTCCGAKNSLEHQAKADNADLEEVLAKLNAIG
ncbi:DUF542 domain-containing protein [Anaerobacillus sp. MEB173]|uniref:DUF542 domain-containing protein n=1 Tax=Anaerobacillus sp. MEB173 TaxID=3383345 RepID=UPI003F92A837